MARELSEPLTQCWAEVSTTLTSLADGADLLLTGMSFEESAANVAEYCDIPLATLHFFPLRANGQLLPFLPAPLGRCRDDGVRVAGVARAEEGRGRAAP